MAVRRLVDILLVSAGAELFVADMGSDLSRYKLEMILNRGWMQGRVSGQSQAQWGSRGYWSQDLTFTLSRFHPCFCRMEKTSSIFGLGAPGAMAILTDVTGLGLLSL